METAELIEKEEVINYHFVPVDQKESNITQAKLERALRLGNEYKSKTYITFLTDQDLKKLKQRFGLGQKITSKSKEVFQFH